MFGIKITVVEPGFFRTNLLDAQNVRWVSKVVEDYAQEGTAEDMWSPYNGTQPNDPGERGDALVKIAGRCRILRRCSSPEVMPLRRDYASDRGAVARGARSRDAVQVHGWFVSRQTSLWKNAGSVVALYLNRF